MQKYLPSKQFTKTIAIAIVIGVGIFLLGKVIKNKSVWENKKDEGGVLSIAQNENDYFAKDTDEDGLYDWEEALWDTNPNLEDSDDDGVSDKDEVENKRKEIDVDESYKPDDNNQTEVFAKQLFTTSAVLNQSGNFSQEDLESFSKNIDLSIDGFAIRDRYTLNDIKLSNVPVETYHNSFENLYNSLPNKEIDELHTIALIIENPDNQSNLEKLGKLIILYQKFQDGMILMQTPHNNAGNHLAIVNDLNRVMVILQESVKMNEDPLKVATYLSKYEEYSDSLVTNFESLSLYFSQNGIIN